MKLRIEIKKRINLQWLSAILAAFALLVVSISEVKAIFPASMFDGHAVLSFPDVCKTPAPPAASVAIDYPFILRYGLRRVLSDFGDSAQGHLGNSPKAVATDASGNIFVLSLTNLYKVDRTTGFRTVISDFAVPAQGLPMNFPNSLAVEGSGNILVTDTFGGASPAGFLFRIDPVSGARTVLSDFNDANQGASGRFPLHVAVEASGDILVTDLSGPLFRINPVSGVRSLLSDFHDANQGPITTSPSGVAADAAGRILVTSSPGFVFSVDPVSGFRSVISDSSDPFQGAEGIGPIAVATRDSGGILVIDPGFSGTDFRGVLVSVDPSTGIRQYISDFGFLAQGPLGSEPLDLAVGTAGVVYVVDPKGAGGVGPGTLYEINLHLGTSGTVISEGDQKVEVKQKDPVTGDPVADRVIRVAAEPTGIDLVPALVSYCGRSAVTYLTALDKVNATCGSASFEVVSGPVEMQFFAKDGREAETTLGAGNGLRFEPETFTFTAPVSNPDPALVHVGGANFTILPGQTVTPGNIEIDIKPGDSTNSINLGSNGVIPLAILATSVADGDSVDFDPGTLDQLSLSLAGSSARVKGRSGNVGAFEDVDGDGDLDLVVQFPTTDLDLTAADTEAVLLGQTLDGTLLRGSDNINIVP